MDLKITSDDVMMTSRWSAEDGYTCEACGVRLDHRGLNEREGFDRHTLTRCLQRLHERIGSLRVEVMPDIR